MVHHVIRPIRLGLPKGRVMADTRRHCHALGIDVTTGALRYEAEVHGLPLTVHLLKIQDIARLLADNVLDLGVTGDEWLMENDVSPTHRTMETRSYRAQLCLLTAADDDRPLSAIRSVATPYPRLAARLLTDVDVRAIVVRVAGSTEAMVPEMADAALDVVESGASARANDLLVRTEFGSVTTHLVRSDRCADLAADLVTAALATQERELHVV